MEIEITEKHKEFLYNASLSQYQNLGKRKVHNGHSVFKYDIEENTLTLAEFETKGSTIEFKYTPQYLFIIALNAKNAWKKFNKFLIDVNKVVKQNALTTPITPEEAFSSLEGTGEIKDNKSQET